MADGGDCGAFSADCGTTSGDCGSFSGGDSGGGILSQIIHGGDGGDGGDGGHGGHYTNADIGADSGSAYVAGSVDTTSRQPGGCPPEVLEGLGAESLERRRLRKEKRRQFRHRVKTAIKSATRKITSGRF
jgi:hypothetical protein